MYTESVVCFSAVSTRSTFPFYWDCSDIYVNTGPLAAFVLLLLSLRSSRVEQRPNKIMSASVQDYQLAAAAAGFTIGFGFLTVWEAIKQTQRNRNPLRSVYIYMLWGEIMGNVGTGIIGWLFLNGVLGPT